MRAAVITLIMVVFLSVLCGCSSGGSDEKAADIKTAPPGKTAHGPAGAGGGAKPAAGTADVN